MDLKVYVSDQGIYQENTYLVIDNDSNECLLIDPGDVNDGFFNIIDKTKGLKYIILTHSHGDHIRKLNEFVARYPDTKVYLHATEMANFRHEKEGFARKRDVTNYRVDVNPVDGDELPFGDGTVKLIHTPGHTPGGMCALIGDALFSGDTLFYMSVGRTDLFGGSWEDLKKSIIEKLYVLPEETKVYPGHGPSTTIRYEKRSNPFV
jgi:hydroxyacylglutathione hydrolase